MLTLCPSCNHHYDDSSQSKKCDGWVGHVKQTSTPLEDHVAMVTAPLRRPHKRRVRA